MIVENERLRSRCERYLYSKLAFPILRKVSAVNPLVVYYHIVSDKKVPHITNLYTFRTVAQFKRDMDVLLRFYRPISFQDFLLCLQSNRPLSENCFMLTFDDGLTESYEVIAPILMQKGIPATFFLCSAFVDNKAMAYDLKKGLLAGELRSRKITPTQDFQVRAVLRAAGLVDSDCGAAVLLVDYGRRCVLDRIAIILEYDLQAYLKTVRPYLTSEQAMQLVKMGHSIGAHSIDHPRYGDVPVPEQLRQTLTSVRFVKDRFDVDYGTFSFPHSDARVSKEFFCEVFASGEVDVCFGNQGMLEDSVPRNVQRSSMEKTPMAAEEILGKGFARRCVKKMKGDLIVRRR